MILYYLKFEFAVSKHRIVQAVYDVDAFKFDVSTLSPYQTMTIDENVNQSLCADLAKTVNRTDAVLEGKYYINASNELMEKDGWQEYRPEILS